MTNRTNNVSSHQLTELQEEDYLLIVLEKKIQELKQRTEDSRKVIDSRPEQKDSEILEWKKKYLKDVKGLIQQMSSMTDFRKETERELGELKRRYWSHVNMSMRP